MKTQSQATSQQHNYPAPNANILFAELYERYQPLILAYLRRIVGDHQLAEDLCQETFVKALQHWEQRDQSYSPASWIYRIARNAAYDEFRHVYRHYNVPLFDTISSPERLADDVELRTAVRATLDQLPDHERVPLLMQAVGGCKLREIARVVGCSENGVKSRLVRSRARFQRMYLADG